MPRADLDPALRALTDQLAALGGPRTEDQTVDQVRSWFPLLGAQVAAEEVGAVVDRTLPGPASDIPIRVYRGADVDADAGPLPVLVWFHASGWVIGGLDTTDHGCRKLANRSGCLVVSVDYRLAPEHPYPAPVDDAWAAVKWVAGPGAAELGADPDRIAVGGDSAGGTLAALCAIKARDEGAPALRHQLLVYAPFDLTFETESMRENGEGLLLTAGTMRWFRAHYLPDDVDPSDPGVSPLHAKLDGVCPAHVVTAGYDPLRDEGDAYAAALTAAGVPVVHDQYPTMLHEFWKFPVLTTVADESITRAAEMLRAALE